MAALLAAKQGALRSIEDGKEASQGHKGVKDRGWGGQHLSMALRACHGYRKEDLAHSIAAVS